jgi:hypothetical protein
MQDYIRSCLLLLKSPGPERMCMRPPVAAVSGARGRDGGSPTLAHFTTVWEGCIRLFTATPGKRVWTVSLVDFGMFTVRSNTWYNLLYFGGFGFDPVSWADDDASGKAARYDARPATSGSSSRCSPYSSDQTPLGALPAHPPFAPPPLMPKQLSYPGSKKHRTKASIRVPRMFNHTHSNNMINR